MSWTKRNTCICDECGKFCRPFDEWTYFGTKGGWDDSPEPLDPCHCCEACWPQLKAYWLDKIGQDRRRGDYEKSRAEMEAAEELGLIWIHFNGVGTLGTTDYAEPYQYIPKTEYERLKQLPYWGHCQVCGTERRGGYCGKNECKESYESKVLNRLSV